MKKLRYAIMALALISFCLNADASKKKPKSPEKQVEYEIIEHRGRAAHALISGKYYCKDRSELCYVEINEVDCISSYVRVYAPEGTVQYNNSNAIPSGTTHDYGLELDIDPIEVIEIVPACQ